MRAAILDSNFRYTPAIETDIRRTFARAKERLRAEAAAAPGGPRPIQGLGDDPTRGYCPVTLKPCGNRKASGEWICSRDRECHAPGAAVIQMRP